MIAYHLLYAKFQNILYKHLLIFFNCTSFKYLLGFSCLIVWSFLLKVRHSKLVICWQTSKCGIIKLKLMWKCANINLLVLIKRVKNIDSKITTMKAIQHLTVEWTVRLLTYFILAELYNLEMMSYIKYFLITMWYELNYATPKKSTMK